MSVARNQRLWLIRVVGVAGGGGGSAESGRRGAPHPRWYCCCENASTLARNQRVGQRMQRIAFLFFFQEGVRLTVYGGDRRVDVNFGEDNCSRPSGEREKRDCRIHTLLHRALPGLQANKLQTNLHFTSWGVRERAATGPKAYWSSYSLRHGPQDRFPV